MVFLWAFIAILVLLGIIFMWFFAGVFLKAVLLFAPSLGVFIISSLVGYAAGGLFGGVIAASGLFGAWTIHERWESSDRYADFEKKINSRFYTS